MDKAGTALRRSGVRLKNISSGHADLHMVISDLREVRSLYKSLLSAQSLVWEDLLKWASKERNGIIQESLVHFSQLHAMWTEIQKEFVANLKKFKHQFEMILEGEQHIDKSRAHLKTCEQKESKVKKEMNQPKNKGTVISARVYEERLNEAKAQVKAAQAEITGKVDDLEAMKMIMLKDGLSSLSDYHVEMAEKSVIVFEAHRRVSEGLPEVKDQEIHNLKYTNNEQAKRMVLSTRENVLCYRQSIAKLSPSAPSSPPPYTSSPIGFNIQNNHSADPSNSLPPHYQPSTSTFNPEPYRIPNQNPPGLGFVTSPPEYSEEPGTHRYDLPPRELYENIDGPFSNVSMQDQR